MLGGVFSLFDVIFEGKLKHGGWCWANYKNHNIIKSGCGLLALDVAGHFVQHFLSVLKSA